MKKHICILLLLCLICTVAASCAVNDTANHKPSQETKSYIDSMIEQYEKRSEESDSLNTTSPPQVDEDKTEPTEPTLPIKDEAEQTESAPPIKDEAEPTEPISNANINADDSEIVKIDVDLSALSSTMVYAEVYNIMINPGHYIGKTIKMSGPYFASYYNVTDQYYHYVIIEDATACCAQGLEFVWNGDHVYPDDYPDIQTKIEVVGVFDSYEEFGQIYYCLRADDVAILMN